MDILNENMPEKWSNVNYVMEASIRQATKEDIELANNLETNQASLMNENKGVLLLYLNKEDERKLELYKSTRNNSFKFNMSDPEIKITKSEIMVLKELIEGKTNKAIAGDLFLSVNTVKTHVRSIFQKLGVNTRSAAVTFAHSNNQIMKQLNSVLALNTKGYIK